VSFPALGVGLGYRPQFHNEIIRAQNQIDWLELIAEGFLPLSPARRDLLAQITSKFACVLHCTELSLGSEAPVDTQLLAQLAELAEVVDAPWVSDHFCFTTAGGIRLGHLAPVQWTKANVALMAEKARTVSRELGRPFLLENIAYTFVVPGELSEAQFITSVLEESDCYLLLDVANVFANATNLGFDAVERLDKFPLHRLRQMHIAGGTWEDGVLADSHDAPVSDGVWKLVRHVANHTTIPAVLLERDAAFPDDFDEILGELRLARAASTVEFA
jgi:uncharacterized protein